MPNHVTNQITFGTDAEALAQFQEMLRFVKTKDGPLGTIDFNKLIPMPESLDITSGSETQRGLKVYTDFVYVYRTLNGDSDLDVSNIPEKSEAAFLKVRKDIEPETFKLGKQAYTNIEAYGAPTWYEWCNKNWGTKWNAYDCVPAGPDADTLTFNTAWSDVSELMGILSEKFPDAELAYRWADEDIGFNVGERVFKNGEIIDYDIPEGGSREAYEMAAGIMGVDLKEYDLYLSNDGSTYEYIEDAEPEPVKPPAKKSKGYER